MAPAEHAEPEGTPSQIAVVVPVLNEEASLPETLAKLARQRPRPAEVIVVDGGSEDGTAKAAASSGARVLRAPRGRASQMNAGAAAAKSDILLFLHADTELPVGGLAAVEQALAKPQVMGGCFQLRFDAERQSLILWLWGLATRLWLFRTPRLVFGDRAIFVRRSAFEALDGYSEWPVLEDVDFALRLSKLAGNRGFAFLPLDVLTSARRLLEIGPLRQQVVNCTILALWYLGATPFQLRSWYTYKKPVSK